MGMNARLRMRVRVSLEFSNEWDRANKTKQE